MLPPLVYTIIKEIFCSSLIHAEALNSSLREEQTL